MNVKERNYGVDLLRIVSVFFVVLLHAMYRGGILYEPLSDNQFRVLWFMRIYAMCAVDVFALISGYVGLSEKTDRPRISRFLNLWLEVVFYCLLFTLITGLITDAPLTSWRTWVKNLLPLTTSKYWFFNCYAGLILLMPLINAAVRRIDDRTLKIISLLMVAVYSVYATFAGINFDLFTLDRGYSMVWLAILYFLGAVIKKTGMFTRIKTWQGIAALLVLTVLTELWKIFSWIVSIPVYGRDILSNLLFGYN